MIVFRLLLVYSVFVHNTESWKITVPMLVIAETIVSWPINPYKFSQQSSRSSLYYASAPSGEPLSSNHSRRHGNLQKQWFDLGNPRPGIRQVGHWNKGWLRNLIGPNLIRGSLLFRRGQTKRNVPLLIRLTTAKINWTSSLKAVISWNEILNASVRRLHAYWWAEGPRISRTSDKQKDEKWDVCDRRQGYFHQFMAVSVPCSNAMLYECPDLA